MRHHYVRYAHIVKPRIVPAVRSDGVFERHDGPERRQPSERGKARLSITRAWVAMNTDRSWTGTISMLSTIWSKTPTAAFALSGVLGSEPIVIDVQSEAAVRAAEDTEI